MELGRARLGMEIDGPDRAWPIEQMSVEPHVTSILVPVFVFLTAAVVVVPVFHRLRASPILGYLTIGVAVGPHGLGLIDEVAEIGALAELEDWRHRRGWSLYTPTTAGSRA